jgi:hypothetical protein
MPHYSESYLFGKAEEKKIMPIVADYFKRELKAYPNQYDHHDFYDDIYDYEVKSRTNSKMAYPDTMITLDKMMNLTKPLILLFNYTDRLCFVEYDATKFATYRKKMFARSKRDCDLKEHLFVPIGDLTDICEWKGQTEKNPAYKASNGF